MLCGAWHHVVIPPPLFSSFVSWLKRICGLWKRPQKASGWSTRLHIFADTVFVALQKEKGPESALEENAPLGCVIIRSCLLGRQRWSVEDGGE